MGQTPPHIPQPWGRSGTPPGGCPTALRRCLPPPQHRFSAVVHFAGLKAVGESVQQPLEYYRVNLTGTIRLLEVSGGSATWPGQAWGRQPQQWPVPPRRP